MDETKESSTPSNTTLNDRMLGVEKDILPFLKSFAITIAIYYIAFSPESAAIFLIEYFKVTPTLCLFFLQIALPILLATTISRTITIQWQTLPGRMVTLFLALLLSSPFWVLHFFFKFYKNESLHSKYRELLSSYLKKIEKKAERSKKKDSSRKFLRFNVVLVVVLSLFFGLAAGFDNPLGHLWNKKYNKPLLLTANLHFYCQITGMYNEDECNKWKAERDKYIQNDLSKDKVYWENVFNSIFPLPKKPQAVKPQSSTK